MIRGEEVSLRWKGLLKDGGKEELQTAETASSNGRLRDAAEMGGSRIEF